MQGRIAENVVHFARVLRHAGLPVGTERTLAALRALELVGFERRDRVHAALSCVLIDQPDQQPLFDAAFAAFWRDPKLLERLMAAKLPQVGSRLEPRPPQQRRLADAIAGTDAAPDASEQPLHDRERLALDVALSASSNERLKRMDFESMSAEEYRAAERLAERLPVLVEPVATRRQAAAARGELDLRGVLRRSARDPYGALPPRRRRRERLPPLVVLCDVSGSMQRYSRMFLHWAHALRVHHPAIETLTLGTRLTRITRALALRDPDAAMKAAGDEVSDWAGGTRLGECLRDFNRHWARRLLNARAEVLLLTDGLERDDVSLLSVQARRLRSFAARLIWLNPLLRFDGFEPRAAGIQALLPHVDEFLPAHNLNSLADLARRLADAQRDRRNPMERHRWK